VSRARALPWLLVGGAALAAACAPAPEPRTPSVDRPPVVLLDAPERVGVGETFEVVAVDSFDVDGEIVEAIMRFGDGSPPQLFLRADHAYDEPGLYAIEVFVADDSGLRASARQRVVVE
jgi:hypothetical protein